MKNGALRYGFQFLGSLLILSFVPTNGLKLAAFVLLWGTTFGRMTAKEWTAFGLFCFLFTMMDIQATRHGVFFFLQPTLAGLPLYEFVAWGFLILHSLRMLNGPERPPHPSLRVYVLAIIFAVPFMVPMPQSTLFLCASSVLLLSLIFFHDKRDFAYCGYMIGIGACWEYAGVWTHQWAYPAPPPGGIPLWFMTMWGGIGLFVRRLVYPFVYPNGSKEA